MTIFDKGKNTYKSDLQLGERYKDKTTGLAGHLIAIHFYEHACERGTLRYVNGQQDVTEGILYLRLKGALEKLSLAEMELTDEVDRAFISQAIRAIQQVGKANCANWSRFDAPQPEPRTTPFP